MRWVSSLKRGVAWRKRSLTTRARWLNNLENIRLARTMNDLLSSLEVLCETHGMAAARLEVTNYDLGQAWHTTAPALRPPLMRYVLEEPTSLFADQYVRFVLQYNAHRAPRR